MDNEKQKDEIIALESIYNEEEFSHHEEDGHYQCTLQIFTNLPVEYYFMYKDTRNPELPEEKIKISHLPPLLLYITLPQDYPSKSQPNFTLSSSWLKKVAVAKLCKRLDRIWEENIRQEILFLWIAFLQDETLEFLGMQNGLDISHIYTFYKISTEKAQSIKSLEKSNDTEKKTTDKGTKQDAKNENHVHKRHWKKSKCSTDKRAVFDCPFGINPVQLLIDYNDKRNQIEFKKNFYTCNICFTNKLGENCTKFSPCSHVFCNDCITGYLEVRIKEGNVQNILCPEEKCTSEATPGQIKDLLSPELFAKYDSILLSATLDTMVDIVYCPRRHCQYPVSCEANEQLASCPACQYTFCIYCKMVYHGIEPCKVNSAEKQQLVSEYQAASEEKKIEMETRYGKKRLQGLVENTMSENWINDNSHNCPECHTAIEKSDGCNKMTCGRCKTFFCWLCSAKLNPEKPYLHFQNPQSSCFNMLYHGLITDEDEEDDIDFPAVYLDYDSEDEDFYDDDFVIEFDI